VASVEKLTNVLRRIKNGAQVNLLSIWSTEYLTTNKWLPNKIKQPLHPLFMYNIQNIIILFVIFDDENDDFITIDFRYNYFNNTTMTLDIHFIRLSIPPPLSTSLPQTIPLYHYTPICRISIKIYCFPNGGGRHCVHLLLFRFN